MARSKTTTKKPVLNSEPTMQIETETKKRKATKSPKGSATKKQKCQISNKEPKESAPSAKEAPSDEYVFLSNRH